MKLLATVMSLTLLAFSPVGRAQIMVGQTSGFTGPAAAGVKENTDGAKLYFDHVNSHGGVNGQRVELLSMDDKFEPQLAAENARKLITEKGVITLFMNRGTPHSEAIMPLLTQYKVPLVAPSSGAMVLHKPVNPWIFNVRASYQREAEKAIVHLSTISLTRIAVIQVDDSFGADCMEGVRRGFEKVKLQPVFLEKFDRTKPDFGNIVALAQQHKPQAIMFIGSAFAVAEGTKLLRAAALQAQIVTLSNNASTGFIKLLGDNARGTVVTQVFPYERAISSPMVKEAQDIAAAQGITEVTPAMLEGYAGAKVLVEGLKRAGARPTRASLQQALNGMKRVDIGGLEVNYSETDHTGLDFADLSIISSSGKFMR
jgi:branched-chain amino acid transport system substrate-binding protein